MSSDEITFLSYEEAAQIVAAIQEEEDVDQPNRRILTVYNHNDKEICWFDFDSVIAGVKEEGGTESREDVQNYILNRIPDWVVDI